MRLTDFRGESATQTNPFTKFSDIVSALTAIGHLDVYSLSRESIQRMLPAAPAPTVNGSGSEHATRIPPDDRQFQYRFSMRYLSSMPEANRPIERETFGQIFILGMRNAADHPSRSVQRRSAQTMAQYRLLWRSRVRTCRAPFSAASRKRGDSLGILGAGDWPMRCIVTMRNIIYPSCCPCPQAQEWDLQDRLRACCRVWSAPCLSR